MGNFMTFKVMPLLKMLIRATAMSFCSSFLGWKLTLSNHWMKLMKLLNFQLQNVSLVSQKLLFINFTLKCPENSRSLFRKSVTSRVSGQCDSELWITLNKDTWLSDRKWKMQSVSSILMSCNTEIWGVYRWICNLTFQHAEFSVVNSAYV